MSKETAIKNMFAAIIAIQADAESTGGLTGAVDCPACGQAKALHYGIAASNKHIHARCKTANCIAFMQ